MNAQKRHRCHSEGAICAKRAICASGWTRSFVSALCGLLMMTVLAQSVAALDVPEREHEPQPVLVEMNGWQIFARQAASDGAQLRFSEVQATRLAAPRWVLRADHLIVAPGITGAYELEWLVARGNVRLAGPNDLYVMGDQAVAVVPGREITFWAGSDRPGVSGGDWKLEASRVDVEFEPARVQWTRVSAGRESGRAPRQNGNNWTSDL